MVLSGQSPDYTRWVVCDNYLPTEKPESPTNILVLRKIKPLGVLVLVNIWAN